MLTESSKNISIYIYIYIYIRMTAMCAWRLLSHKRLSLTIVWVYIVAMPYTTLYQAKLMSCGTAKHVSVDCTIYIYIYTRGRKNKGWRKFQLNDLVFFLYLIIALQVLVTKLRKLHWDNWRSFYTQWLLFQQQVYTTGDEFSWINFDISANRREDIGKDVWKVYSIVHNNVFSPFFSPPHSTAIVSMWRKNGTTTERFCYLHWNQTTQKNSNLCWSEEHCCQCPGSYFNFHYIKLDVNVSDIGHVYI